jgi:CDP-paratose 2-epimerase
VQFAQWRHGDQRYFVADTRRFGELSGWAPRVDVREGVKALHRWFQQYPPGSAAHSLNTAEMNV